MWSLQQGMPKENQTPQVDTSATSPVTRGESAGNQLSYPLDYNSAKILERQQLNLKYPQAYMKNVGRIMLIKFNDDGVVLTTGDGKFFFPVPEELDNTQIIAAHAAVSTVSSSGTPTIQIRNVTDSVDVLTTRITIDASEFTSYTAEIPPVISFANAQLAKADIIAIDVDVAGTGAKGGTLILTIQ